MAARRTARVLLVDANERLASLLASLLNDELDYAVTDVVEDPARALEVVRERPPDMVIADAYVTDRAALQELRAAAPQACFLMWFRGHGLSSEIASLVDGVLERGMTFREVVAQMDAARARHAQHRAEADAGGR